MSGGACNCGFLCSSRACAVTAASTSSAASGGAREFPLREALWKSLLLPGLLTPSCSCRFTATLESDWEVLDDLVLSLFCHVVDVMCFLTDLLCVLCLLHDCENFDRRDPLVRFPYLRFFMGFSELSPIEAASPSFAVLSG